MFARLLHKLAAGFALLGGFVLCLLALLVVTSIVGRMLFLMPVPGDFEIAGIGTAIAIFLCLPYCQLQRAHVTVDVFLAHAPERVRRLLDAIANLAFALIALAFAWRMSVGLGDMLRQWDITMIVGIPLWIAFPFGIAAFLLLGVCCVYTAVEDLRAARP